MVFEVLSNRLMELAKELDSKMPTLIATVSMMELQAEWGDRIFKDGLNSSGAPIGTYSQESAYFSKSKFVRQSAFKAQGKRGYKGQRIVESSKVNRDKKTGKTSSGGAEFKVQKFEVKSMYLSKGYSEFREIQGREETDVNLNLSGSMQAVFKVYKFGTEVLFGNADAMESMKVQGNTERFGDWASMTETEKKNLLESIADEAVIIVKNENTTRKT